MRRRAELAVIRARGASLRQILLGTAVGAALVCVPAAVIGVVLAILAVPGAGSIDGGGIGGRLVAADRRAGRGRLRSRPDRGLAAPPAQARNHRPAPDQCQEATDRRGDADRRGGGRHPRVPQPGQPGRVGRQPLHQRRAGAGRHPGRDHRAPAVPAGAARAAPPLDPHQPGARVPRPGPGLQNRAHPRAARVRPGPGAHRRRLRRHGQGRGHQRRGRGLLADGRGRRDGHARPEPHHRAERRPRDRRRARRHPRDRGVERALADPGRRAAQRPRRGPGQLRGAGGRQPGVPAGAGRTAGGADCGRGAAAGPGVPAGSRRSRPRRGLPRHLPGGRRPGPGPGGGRALDHARVPRRRRVRDHAGRRDQVDGHARRRRRRPT